MSWMEEVGLEEELKEERVEKLDELVTQVVDQMMVPAEGGNGVQVWEAATLASREKLEAGDEEKKEVSNALRTLREKYDQIRRHVMEKEHALEQLNVSQLDLHLAVDW